jgi:hypothetical protein
MFQIKFVEIIEIPILCQYNLSVGLTLFEEFKLKNRTTQKCNATLKNVKAILVTCRVGASSCETSRLPHCLDNRLTDGGEVVSLTRRPPFAPQEDSWYSFLLDAYSSPGP